MRTRKLALCLVACLAGGFTTAALAHHGTGVNYMDDEVVVLKGTVTRLVWRNPHSALILDVTTESGEVVSHAVELGSPAAMVQSRGWSRQTFKPGDVVEIKVHPSRTGAPVSLNASCADGGCDVVINGELLKNTMSQDEQSQY
jgi:Family of unknown function (DUF6152)